MSASQSCNEPAYHKYSADSLVACAARTCTECQCLVNFADHCFGIPAAAAAAALSENVSKIMNSCRFWLSLV